MRRFEKGALAISLLLLLVSGVGRAFFYTDPTSLYSTVIWDHWVYQARHSNSVLTVFYGEGDHELLYFEQLGKVEDNSVQELAERSLTLYQGAGGLQGFELRSPLEQISVGGQTGLSCTYSYEDGHGNILWEQRIFIILPGKQGFSIALCVDKPLGTDSPHLDDILRGWRWLF